MASTPTTNLLLEKQGKFENTETWDELLNAAIDQIDYAISGTAAIATTGGTTTLDNANYTVDDAKAAVLYITGTLASNSEIVVPSTSRVYVVRNATSGAYSVTVKTAAGSGVVVTQGTVQFVAVDATADDTYAVSVAGSLGVASDSGTASVDLETQSLTLTGGTGIDTSATGQAATIAIDSTVATLTGAQTLTNKSIDLTSNTLTGTQAQFDTACSDGNFVYTDDIGASVQAYDADTAKYDDVTANFTGTLQNGGSNVIVDTDIGATVQAYAANLDTWAGIAPSANGSSLVAAANYAAMRTLLDLEAGTDFYSISAADAAFQPLDAVLTDLAGLTLAQGEVLYFNGTNLVALGVGTNGQVLTSGGAAANVSWTTAAGSGDVSSSAAITDNALVRGDGGAKGVQETGIIVADTTNDISGVGSITPVAGSAIRTATTATNTLLLQAYDVDGAAYTTFGTLTAGNTPSFTLSSPIINTPALSADSVDAITEIASALKSGSDATLITGTAGTSGDIPVFDANGDIVGSGLAPANWSIATSVGSSALTIALKTTAGSDPSSTTPVSISFRSATATTGTLTTRVITAATSLVISSGSTMGFADASAGRLWVVAFDDAGTVRLGAINCLSGGASPTGVTAIPDIASSTAEGGAGAADSAAVFYTGSAVTSKPLVILGWIEWSSGLTTAGTWDSAGTKLHVQQPWDKVPGAIVQVSSVTKTDTFTTTATTMTDVTGLTTSITPTSAANIVLGLFSLTGQASTGASAMGIQSVRDSTAIGIGESAGSRRRLSTFLPAPTTAFFVLATSWNVLDKPEKTTATTYKTQILGTAAGTVYVNRMQSDSDSATYIRTASGITVQEIMS